MLGLILSAYLSISIILCFVKIRYGIAMFLLYSLLVPYLKFFSFGINLFTFLIFIALLYNYNVKSLIYKPLKPFLFLYLAQLLIIPFHNVVPYNHQLNMFRVDFMSTILLPFAIMNVINRDNKALALFTRILIIALSIAALYTLFLTIMPGLNPYLMVILPLSGQEFNEAYALAADGGRVFGRISGVFTHPMTNGLFLSFSAIFLFTEIDFKHVFKSILPIILFLIVLLATLFMGVRTTIGALGIGLIVFLIYGKKFELILWGTLTTFILLFFIQQIPGMEDYIRSIVDPGSSNVSGSSIDMRMRQLYGAFNEIKNNMVFGDGYGWTSYYLSSHSGHPVMLAFESLIIVILCNNGIMGIIIWSIMILMYVKYVYKNHYGDQKAILIALIVTYIAYSIITGEYGYMKYFLIFYTIISANNTSLERIKIKNRE